MDYIRCKAICCLYPFIFIQDLGNNIYKVSIHIHTTNIHTGFYVGGQQNNDIIPDSEKSLTCVLVGL